MNFSWDPEKDAANRRKHKISFRVAVDVFADPFCEVLPDRLVDGEQRWHAIGRIPEGFILLVVHTVKDEAEEDIRIVSARKVTRNERKLYQGGDNAS